MDMNEKWKFLRKFTKKKSVGGVGLGVFGLGGQSGCVRRIEVFVKIQQQKIGGGGGQVVGDWVRGGGGSGWM